MNTKKPLHISNAVKKVFEGITKAEAGGVSNNSIMQAWGMAAGPQALKHTSLAGLRNKTLIINVDSTPWIYQLRLQEKELIRKMSGVLNEGAIKKLRFRAGEVKD